MSQDVTLHLNGMRFTHLMLVTANTRTWPWGLLAILVTYQNSDADFEQQTLQAD
jgi:hypothetical protein